MGAQVSPPCQAIAAAPADHMALARYDLSRMKIIDVSSDFNNFTDKFMAHYHGYGNRFLSPTVPVVDVKIGTTNGSAPDFDQYIVDADLRLLDTFKPKPLCGMAFDQCFHVTVAPESYAAENWVQSNAPQVLRATPARH